MMRCFSFDIGIDALLTVFLVVGAFQFMEHRNKASEHEVVLEHSGAVEMSNQQLFNHLRNQRASAFWLGPIQDARYATEDLAPGQITITYIQHGTSLYDLADPKRTIQTFNDIAAFRDMGYAFRDSNTLVTTTMKLGRTVIFDSSVMNTEIVLFSNDPEVVVITYVDPKHKSELISNADSLRTVW